MDNYYNTVLIFFVGYLQVYENRQTDELLTYKEQSNRDYSKNIPLSNETMIQLEQYKHLVLRHKS